MLKYSWNETRRPIARSLLVAVSPSMVPIVYPVLHALISSYLFIAYIRHHARLDKPGKVPTSRSRELRFFLDIIYAPSSTTYPLPRRVHRTHTYARTYTYTRGKKLVSSRDRDLPFSEEIDKYNLRAAPLRWFVFTFENGEEQSEDVVPRVFLGSTLSLSLYPSTHTFIYKITYAAFTLVDVN